MATENITFKLELFATMWDKPPVADILLNGTSHAKQEITGTEEEPQIIEFKVDLEEGQGYDLVVSRSNKTDSQTIVNEKGDILKDQMLHIKKIHIDEIDIGSLIFEGVYKPEYPEPWATKSREKGLSLPETLKNSPIMGHNGTWTFKFSSPFYMWLLENLY
tara:strand:+ start:219 stop:701 length:483 start_codon:yes stop_codon:yes gene_type:complete